MKVALILGVEIHTNVGFVDLKEPPEDQSTQSKSSVTRNDRIAHYLTFSLEKKNTFSLTNLKKWCLLILSLILIYHIIYDPLFHGDTA